MDIIDIQERVILIAAATPDVKDAGASLDELALLADTAGASVVGRLIQQREAVHPATYLGKGKLDELAVLIRESGANGVIADDPLSPAQMKNLSERFPEVKIMDRTVLILDIFAAHANTREGTLQVELALLRYQMTRLSGYGTAMSRLGGGIGTRGPGETKLETDRRRIRERISSLKQNLKDVERHRAMTRGSRKRSTLPVAALVGYTNAGKSSLLKAITGAEVYTADQLFATLDPLTRTAVLPGGENVLFTDTVGFISKLPHELVEAFRSTLEEARYADVILHVVDSANPDRDKQMAVVYETLDKLGAGQKPVITLFNKCDLPDPDPYHIDRRADRSLNVSALTGAGIPEFLTELSGLLRDRLAYIERLFSFRDAALISRIRKYGQLIEEKYTEDGIFVRAYCPKHVLSGLTETVRPSEDGEAE